MDRRKNYPRVPLWIRSSGGERSGTTPNYRQQPYWPPQQQQRPHERPPKRRSEPRSKKGGPRRRVRPPRYELVATEQITLRSPVHLADWEQRAELIDDFEELVHKAEETGEAPWVIQVWKIGEEYVLARGFAALAAAVEAELAEVRVVVAARFPRWELLWVDPQSITGPDPLLSKALDAQKKIQTIGWTFPPLAVTPESGGGYALGRGKRAAARLWAAQEEKVSQVPIVLRPQSRRSLVAGTVQVEVSRVQVNSPRHLRKMNKPLPTRLLNEAAAGHLRPIRVRRAGDGKFELVDGLLRLRAAQEVGLRTIQAIIEVELSRD